MCRAARFLASEAKNQTMPTPSYGPGPSSVLLGARSEDGADRRLLSANDTCKDDNTCLQAEKGWSKYTCEGSIEYCYGKYKAPKKCCKKSCGECASQGACEDDASWRDSKKTQEGCSSWEGYNCAIQFRGYGPPAVVMAKCKKTCGLCHTLTPTAAPTLPTSTPTFTPTAADQLSSLTPTVGPSPGQFQSARAAECAFSIWLALLSEAALFSTNPGINWRRRIPHSAV